MEPRAAYVAVGAFILTLSMGVVAFILWIGNFEWGRQSNFYEIYVEGSVTGLSEGEWVRYKGVPIGTVTNISIDPNDLQHVKVTIDVDIPDLIREDAVASLETTGITGVSYVQINGGSLTKPPLKALKEQGSYPVINSKPSRLEEVFQTIPKVLDKMDKLADSLNQLLSPKNRESFQQFLTSLERASGHLEQLMIQGDKFLQEGTRFMDQSGRDLHESLQTFNKGMEETQKVMGDLGKILSENRGALRDFVQSGLGQMGPLVTQGKDTLNDISKASQQIENSLKSFIDHESTYGKEVHE